MEENNNNEEVNNFYNFFLAEELSQTLVNEEEDMWSQKIYKDYLHLRIEAKKQEQGVRFSNFITMIKDDFEKVAKLLSLSNSEKAELSTTLFSKKDGESREDDLIYEEQKILINLFEKFENDKLAKE